MRPARRIVLVGFGVVLYVLAAMFLVDLNPSDECADSHCGAHLVTVIVSRERIPANQDLDALIDRGVFHEIQIPEGARIEGAVTDIRQLEGVSTATVILKYEQISPSHLSTEAMT